MDNIIQVKISAIVSTYNSEKFIRGCLEDLINQTLFKKGELEIIIVNSGSQQNEDRIVREYLDNYDNIVYIKTEKREGIYAAWNRAIKASSGEYVTNANTDDRHRSDALEIMLDELEKNDVMDLVYADSKFTVEENKNFTDAPISGYFLWPEYDYKHLFEICFIGPQPMWRKSLHEQFGYFDENFVTAGDYEFWLRIAKENNILHIPKILGSYLYSLSSIEHQNENKSISESHIARKKHWQYQFSIKGNNKNYLVLFLNSPKVIINPKVSIIIPTYNRLNLLFEALDSLAKQSYKNFEVIVINDGTLSVEKIIEKYGSILSIKIIQHTVNLGRSISRNHGIRVSKGEYIGFLDDDDILYENHIELLLNEIEKRQINVVYADSIESLQKTDGGGWINRTFSADFSFEGLLVHNVAPIQAFLFNASVIKKSGGFDINLDTHEDWDLWIKLAKQNTFFHLKEITSEFRKRNNGVNTTYYNIYNFLYTLRLIYKRNEKNILQNKSILQKQEDILNSLVNRCLARRLEAPVSIVIVTYNSEENIDACLKSVINIKREIDEVIIVDNASQDNTISIISKYQKLSKVKIILNSKNLGFSKAVNQGCNESNGFFVCLLNPDAVVFNGWLDKMINHFDSPSIGAVGPISNYAAGLQNISVHFENYKNVKIVDVQNGINIGREREYYESKLLIGFCLMIRRDILDIEFNGLDENLFLGNDDLDLSWRLRLAGYKLKIALDTFVFHEGQKSFQTREKSETDTLVQQSTDALYSKLVQFYGEGNVPSPLDIWGINWFKPTNAKFELPSKKFVGNNNIKVSIIIPTFNKLELTHACIKSILDNTEYKHYEIIIVDNGSTDGTVDFLKIIEDSTDILKVIYLNENLGFPKAVNYGLHAAKSNHIVIANNDIVLTKNWLKKMLAIAESGDEIGIVGPISNKVSGVQQVENADYNSIEEMHKYAEKIARENNGKVLEFPRVAFLCTLIKREVINKIGGLDERFSPGNYEDDDFCLRAQIAGFKTIIAQDVFIHHYGSKSFKADGETQYDKLLETNKQKFIDKWGATPDDIWLHGKKVNSAVDLYCSINKGSVEVIFNKALEMINNENYESAKKHLDECIKLQSESSTPGFENEKIIELRKKVEQIIISEKETNNRKTPKG